MERNLTVPTSTYSANLISDPPIAMSKLLIQQVLFNSSSLSWTITRLPRTTGKWYNRSGL